MGLSKYLTVVALAACGSSGDDLADVGGECFDGSGCKGDLVCYVTGTGPEGVCTEMPASCNGELDCQCLGELNATCDGSSRCSGRLGEYIVACTPDGTAPKAEGEACSRVRTCADGLYCKISGSGEAGECLAVPSACTPGDLECDCFDDVCSTTHQACSIGGGTEAVIECHN